MWNPLEAAANLHRFYYEKLSDAGMSNIKSSLNIMASGDKYMRGLSGTVKLGCN